MKFFNCYNVISIFVFLYVYCFHLCNVFVVSLASLHSGIRIRPINQRSITHTYIHSQLMLQSIKLLILNTFVCDYFSSMKCVSHNHGSLMYGQKLVDNFIDDDKLKRPRGMRHFQFCQLKKKIM